MVLFVILITFFHAIWSYLGLLGAIFTSDANTLSSESARISPTEIGRAPILAA